MEKKVFKIRDEIDTILCDIEGTTTSISFVKDVLFPYVRNNLREHLINNIDTQECIEDINLLTEKAEEDEKNYEAETVPLIRNDFNDKEKLVESVIKNVYWQMDADRKTKALKQLQGHIWKKAYENGSVKGHVYDDVVPAFDRWKKRHIKIYIYSSGSVQAQKLLFGYSEKGNLLHYLSGHFDPTIGVKVDCTSYENILKSLGKKHNQVLFLTDLLKEAEAAEKVGIDVCVIRREDNSNTQVNNFNYVSNFNEIE